MAAESVGQIGLDLVVNKKDFEKQMAGIKSLAKKAGAALASAFAVKKIWDFGAACVELGSDLQEVQNVVDVTFPQMSKQVDDFAKNAAAQFGLSETMAKKFTGTFGAMAKAFGFNEQSAYEMSTALTGLSGDVASFYNMSQEEAFTKLKSVFTGETESLKDLGVVMTQAALDQYALSNGFGRTTAAMSEAEKVALRYQFVTEQLSLASGDFVRTSDGWANQVRVLKLQFESLQATIGQGLINVLTPVIKVINTIIGKLMSLANAFKAFTEMLTGKKSGGGASAAAAGMEAVAASADNASTAIGGTGSAAKKAAKEIKGATTGIDELNIIDQGDSGSGGSGGGAGGGDQADQFDMGEIAPLDDEVDARYQTLIDRVKELQGLFKEGFQAGFGDLSVLDSVQVHLDNIKASLQDIFTDDSVQQASNQFVESFVLNLGKVTGSIASIGASLGDFLVGAVDKYLSKNSDFLKNKIVALFDIGSEVSRIAGELSAAVAEIFAVLRLDSFKDIGASLIEIVGNTALNLSEIFLRVKTDAFEKFALPIIENKDRIVEALSGLGDLLAPIVGLIADAFTYVGQKINDVYAGIISPVIGLTAQLVSDKVGVILEAFNSLLLPVLQHIGDKIQELRDGAFAQLAEAFDSLVVKVSELVQAVTSQIQVLLDQYLMPLVDWIINAMAPYITTAINLVVDAFFWFLEQASSVIDGVLEALGGLIDFLTGVFTGDWKKAWTGIKTFLSSVWELMKALVQAAIEAISAVIASVLAAIQTDWDSIWTGIKDFAANIWQAIRDTISSLIDAIHTKISSVMETIKTAISTALENVKKAWNDTWDNLKQKTEDIFEGIWSTIKGIINKILGGIEKMANGVVKAINKMIEAINDVADHVPGIDDSLIPTIPELHLPRLAQGGFVKANTPQLAMIGDNRHYGEIVAPEDKMQEMVNRAAALAAGMNGGVSDQYLLTMIELLQRIIELIENLDLTVNIDIREIKKKLVDLEKRSGYTLRTT